MSEFHEDWQNPEADPLAPTASEFPYATVFAHLDGDKAEDAMEAAEALRQLLTWVVSIKGHPDKARRHVCARALAMAWTINPDMLNGQSLNAVARRFGISSDVMHRASSDFSKVFGVRNRAQISRAWNWKPEPGPSPVAALSKPRSPKPPVPPPM
jgi:hypothetical protein